MEILLILLSLVGGVGAGWYLMASKDPVRYAFLSLWLQNLMESFTHDS